MTGAIRLRDGGGWCTLARNCRRVGSKARVGGKELQDGQKSRCGVSERLEGGRRGPVRRPGIDVVAQRVQGIHEIYRDAEETYPSLHKILKLVEVYYCGHHHIPVCINESVRADDGVRSLVGLIGDKLELLRDLGVDTERSLLQRGLASDSQPGL